MGHKRSPKTATRDGDTGREAKATRSGTTRGMREAVDISLAMRGAQMWCRKHGFYNGSDHDKHTNC